MDPQAHSQTFSQGCRSCPGNLEAVLAFAALAQTEREVTTMSTYKSNDENIPTQTKDYYEEIASQEEVYLEEREEELRAILTSHDPFPSRNSSCVLTENRGDRELVHR